MSYRSSYGSGYSSSSFRRPYTPSYSSSSSYSPSYSTSSSSSPYSSSLYRPSTYSTFLSTYRRPSFGSTSYSSKRTNSSEDLHGSTDDKYSTRDSDSGSTGLRKSNFSRSLGNLSRASFDDDNDGDNAKDSLLRDKYGRSTDDVDYKEMYENEKSIRMSEQATLIEELQAQIELRKQIIQIFEQLTPLDEELEQEKERCNLLEQLQSRRDEHDRLVKQQQQQQQSSQKGQPKSGVQNNRSTLGSRRF